MCARRPQVCCGMVPYDIEIEGGSPDPRCRPGGGWSDPTRRCVVLCCCVVCGGGSVRRLRGAQNGGLCALVLNSHRRKNTKASLRLVVGSSLWRRPTSRRSRLPPPLHGRALFTICQFQSAAHRHRFEPIQQSRHPQGCCLWCYVSGLAPTPLDTPLGILLVSVYPSSLGLCL